jgi:glutaminyl-tRNA synthetase
LDTLEIYKPQQIEFARLALTYTVLSKRRLIRLVAEGHVNSWDDPRMPTISGLRRRGYTPEALRTFTDMVGVAKANSTIDFAMLEYAIRDDLNQRAPRAMGVLRPLKLVIENYPETLTELFEVPTFPQNREDTTTREVPFSREIYIEQEDFMEDPPGKFYRLSPGKEVRLLGAYLVTCTSVVKDDDGNVVEVCGTYDPESKGGNAPDGRKVKGTLHWVSARHAVKAELRLYDVLYTKENPMDHDDDEDFTDFIDPDSLEVLTGAMLEPGLAEAKVGDTFQFMRQGYFCLDPDNGPGQLVFNQTVSLRDSWSKIQNQR